jgi:DNA helicase II / ATP-dependent DNA helicase PcrA
MSSPSPNRVPFGYEAAAASLRDNPGQWAAYESTRSAVLLAGPGSGKTKTLVIKVARILHEEVSLPQRIACITFSNACADELADRLAAVGVSDAAPLYVGTVHSFCLTQILLPFARVAGADVPDPIVVASTSEQRTAFRTALDFSIGRDERTNAWKSRFDKYRRTHLDRSLTSFQTDDPQLATLVAAYERNLRARGGIDFDDIMLIGTMLVERHAWVRTALCAKFPILVIDEYQDLGEGLHRMVLALLHSGTRVIAVGDPDQSIYGFVGAKPELLQALAAEPNVDAFHLQFNYRCGQVIVDASETAIGAQRGYKSKSTSEGTIDFRIAKSGLEEQAEIVFSEIIPSVLASGDAENLGDIAILYRTAEVGDVFAKRADKEKRAYIRLDSRGPYPSTPFTKWLEECSQWCAGGWRQGSPRLGSLLRICRNLLCRSNPSREGVAAFESAVVQFLMDRRTPDMPLRQWLSEFDAMCLAGIMALNPALRDDTDTLAEMIVSTNAEGDMAGYLVRTLAGQSRSPQHLNLITLHSCKGLEYGVVIMVGMDRGAIDPNHEGAAEIAEGRRLFYVGLTRAKRRVCLLCSGWITRLGQRRDWGVSRFVIEVYHRLNPAVAT